MAETQSSFPSAPQQHPTRSDEAAKPSNAATQDSNNRPDETAKAAAAGKDPMRELLDQMERLRPMIAAVDPNLGRIMQSLSQQGADPERRAQQSFRTGVAYALEDLEKAHTGRLELPSALRAETTQLAGTAPGLENERMLAVMRGTASIDDRSLVKEIRMLASDIAKKADQDAPDIASKVSVVENRVRHADRPPEPVQETRAPSQTSSSASPADRRAQASEAGLNPNDGGRPGDTRMSNNGKGQGDVTVQHSVLDTLLRAMRPDPNQPSPPWEPAPTRMVDRLASAERTISGRLEERAFTTAEQNGKAALDALQDFTNGGGASVMTRIREAAKTEPGGLPQVLSEMRDGGRFADLRKQFSNALVDDAGAAASYDKAASSLAAYGKNRTDVQDIIGRRTDNNALTQRFEQLDAEIGKASSSTPSKTEGRSMMEDLSKQAAELLQRAVDAVRSAFRPPSANAAANASPSPT